MGNKSAAFGHRDLDGKWHPVSGISDDRFVKLLKKEIRRMSVGHFFFLNEDRVLPYRFKDNTGSFRYGKCSIDKNEKFVLFDAYRKRKTGEVMLCFECTDAPSNADQVEITLTEAEECLDHFAIHATRLITCDWNDEPEKLKSEPERQQEVASRFEQYGDVYGSW